MGLEEFREVSKQEKGYETRTLATYKHPLWYEKSSFLHT